MGLVLRFRRIVRKMRARALRRQQLIARKRVDSLKDRLQGQWCSAQSPARRPLSAEIPLGDESRDGLMILDGRGLEAIVCGCYAVIRDAYARIS